MDRPCGIETRDDGVKICSVHKNRLKLRSPKMSKGEPVEIAAALFWPESGRTVPLPAPVA